MAASTYALGHFTIHDLSKRLSFSSVKFVCSPHKIKKKPITKGQSLY